MVAWMNAMDERRYRDDEVEAIFEAAASETPTPRGSRSSEGLTLTELQEIGREVGIDPTRIAEAARGLARVEAHDEPRTLLGVPYTVARSAELPRRPTDREWALVVSDLRQTFRASGTERIEGETRSWRNGNLHAFVEPSPDGYRIRLGSLKGNAVPVAAGGGIVLVFGLIALVTLLVGGGDADIGSMLTLLGLGVGALGFNAVRLPRWRNERAHQMEGVMARTRALLEGEGEGDPPRNPGS